MVVRKVNIYKNPGVTTLLSSLGDRGKQALAQALNEESQLIFRDSQKIVPHADGPLQSSGRLTPAKSSDVKPEVTIGYGGAASAYALKQHEDLTLRHPDPRNPKSRAGGKPKYLENPVREHVPALKQRIYDRINALTGKV